MHKYFHWFAALCTVALSTSSISQAGEESMKAQYTLVSFVGGSSFGASYSTDAFYRGADGELYYTQFNSTGVITKHRQMSATANVPLSRIVESCFNNTSSRSHAYGDTQSASIRMIDMTLNGKSKRDSCVIRYDEQASYTNKVKSLVTTHSLHQMPQGRYLRATEYHGGARIDIDSVEDDSALGHAIATPYQFIYSNGNVTGANTIKANIGQYMFVKHHERTYAVSYYLFK